MTTLLYELNSYTENSSRVARFISRMLMKEFNHILHGWSTELMTLFCLILLHTLSWQPRVMDKNWPEQ